MARIHEILEIHDRQPDGTMVPTGRYRATVRSDEEGWVHGECACMGNYMECPGHASVEEAQTAYRRAHLKDIAFHKNDERQTKCQVCGEWTQNVAWIPGLPWAAFTLCDAHNTREQVEVLYLKQP